MPARTRQSAPKPGPQPTPQPEPTPEPTPETTAGNGNVKVSAELLAKYQAMAAESLAKVEVTVTTRQAPAVVVTDADREFVRNARKQQEENKGTWLTSKLPTEIPAEIAAKMLTQRFNVISAAAKELGFVPRRAAANESKHVLKFRINLPADSEGKSS